MADPLGFLVARPRGGGSGSGAAEPVGCISAVRHGCAHGFVGFFIVAPPWRRRGEGRRLWAAALARLAGRAVALDAVGAQAPCYARDGFRAVWRTARWTGVPRLPALLPAAATPALLDARDVPFDELVALDARASGLGAPRPALLAAWLAAPGHTSVAARALGGALCGLGVRRRASAGLHRIAPLLADSPEALAALVRALCAPLPRGDGIAWDAPNAHPHAAAMAAAMGLRHGGELVHMHRPAPAAPGEQPPPPPAAPLSLELG